MIFRFEEESIQDEQLDGLMTTVQSDRLTRRRLLQGGAALADSGAGRFSLRPIGD
jgi:hypothetical protein